MDQALAAQVTGLAGCGICGKKADPGSV